MFFVRRPLTYRHNSIKRFIWQTIFEITSSLWSIASTFRREKFSGFSSVSSFFHPQISVSHKIYVYRYCSRPRNVCDSSLITYNSNKILHYTRQYTILKWLISKYVTLFITGTLRSDSISGIGRGYPPRVPVAETSFLWNVIHYELVFSPCRFADDWRKSVRGKSQKKSFHV